MDTGIPKRIQTKNVHHLTSMRTVFLKWSLSGYSLVLVLTLITIFSFGTLLVIQYSFQTKKNLLTYKTAIDQRLIAESVRDSLLAFPEKLNSAIHNLTDFSDRFTYRNYDVQLRTIRWGIKTYLEVNLQKGESAVTFTYEVSRKLPLPDNTVLIYNNPSFGLAYSEGASVSGNILLRRPEFRNSGTSVKVVKYSGKIYQLHESINEYVQFLDSDSDKAFQTSGGLTIYKIDDSHYSFEPERNFVNTVFLFTKPITVRNFPNGYDNQYIFLKNAEIKFSGELNGTIIQVGDSLKVSENSKLSGALFQHRQNFTNRTKQVLKFGKNCEFNGFIFSDGILQYEQLSVTGLLLVSGLTVVRPPTTYVHYLMNITVKPNSVVQPKYVSLPAYWFGGGLTIE